MKYVDWDPVKNRKLKEERGISFEEILIIAEAGGLLSIARHPNQKRYPHQFVFIVEFEEYVYLVPFVEDEEKIFLKTIIPSRKMTQDLL